MTEIFRHGKMFKPENRVLFTCPECGCQFTLPISEINRSWYITSEEDLILGEDAPFPRPKWHECLIEKCPECSKYHRYEMPEQLKESEKSDGE